MAVLIASSGTSHAAENPILHRAIAGSLCLIGIIIGRQDILVIISIHPPSQHNLTRVAHALHSIRLLLGPGQCRQKQRCQDGDNGDNHQQLNQGEAPVLCASILTFGLSFHSISLPSDKANSSREQHHFSAEVRGCIQPRSWEGGTGGYVFPWPVIVPGGIICAKSSIHLCTSE